MNKQTTINILAAVFCAATAAADLNAGYTVSAIVFGLMACGEAGNWSAPRKPMFPLIRSFCIGMTALSFMMAGMGFMAGLYAGAIPNLLGAIAMTLLLVGRPLPPKDVQPKKEQP